MKHNPEPDETLPLGHASSDETTPLNTPGHPQETTPVGAPVPASAPQPRSEQPGQIIDRYKLDREIGEGGFGTVWMAEQLEPVKRRVALKVIKLGMDTRQVITRFEAERQALAVMDHPSIAKVFDAGSTAAGRPYFVMEYIDGVPLTEYCDAHKLDTTQRLELFITVCSAIQHAHQKGIIHRDIKPSNVLVSETNGDPLPKVIDFGIAKATDTEATQQTMFTEQRQIVGTPVYMSPEQAESSTLDIDTRSDVYSLGVLLYELLTGTTPFEGQSLMAAGFAEMLRIIREEEPRKPSTRLSSLGDTASHTAELRGSDTRKLSQYLHGDLDWIVMKCLEKDRSRRYDTANGLAADIRRHLADEPVTAGPPSTRYRLSKFVRRNRVQVVAASVVAAVLLLGAFGTTLGMFWALDEKARADDEAHRAKLAAAAETKAKQRADDNAARAEAARQEEQIARTAAERIAYRANLAAAASASAVNDAKSAKAFLSRTPPRLRGWEHQLLWSECDRSVRTEQFRPHALADRGRAVHTELSSDARLAIVRVPHIKNVDRSGAAVMNLADWTHLASISVTGGFERVTVFSPDQRYVGLGTTALPQTLVYDLKTQKPLAGGWARGSFIGFSPDSTRALISYGTQIGVMSLPSGELERVPSAVALHNPGEARFSPDGRVLAIGLSGTRTRVLDAETFSPLAELDVIDPSDMSFSKDGKYLALAHSSVSVFETASWTRQLKLLPDGAGAKAVRCFTRPQDAYPRLAIGRSDGVIQILDMQYGVTVDELRGQSGAIVSIAYDSETQELVSADIDGMFYWWDAERTTRVAVTQNRDEVAFVADGVAVIADPEPGEWTIVSEWQNHAVFNPQWHRPTGGARLYDYVLGEKLDALYSTPSTTAHVLYNTGFALAPDGRRLATSESNNFGHGRLRIYDLWSGAALHTIDRHIDAKDGEWDVQKSFTGDASACAWSPDGTLLAIVAEWNSPLLYDGETYELVGPMWKWPRDRYDGHRAAVLEVRFTPDGSTLISTDANGTIIGWDIARKAKSWEIVLGNVATNAMSLDITRDGSAAAVGTAAGLVVIFEPGTGQEIIRIAAHANRVFGVWFDDLAERLVTCGAEIKIWDTSDYSELVTLSRVQTNLARLSPDGQHFVTLQGKSFRFTDLRPEIEAVAVRRSARQAQIAAQPVLDRLERETGGDPVAMYGQITADSTLSPQVRRAAILKTRHLIERRLAAAYDVRRWVPQVLPRFDRWVVANTPLTSTYFTDVWAGDAAEETAEALGQTALEKQALREMTVAMRGEDMRSIFDTLVIGSAWRLLLLNRSLEDAELVAQRMTRSLADQEPFSPKTTNNATHLRLMLGFAHLRAGRPTDALTVLEQSQYKHKIMVDALRALALHAAGRTEDGRVVYEDVQVQAANPAVRSVADMLQKVLGRELEQAFRDPTQSWE